MSARPRVRVVPFPLPTRQGNPRWLATCDAPGCTFARLTVVRTSADFEARCHRNTPHPTKEGH